MRGTVFIEGMRFHACHGVGRQERRTGHTFVVSVSVECDVTGAAERDDIAGTVSYADLYAVVAREMSIASCLVEHVAWRIAGAVFAVAPSACVVTVQITKENPPVGGQCAGAGVRIAVTRDDIASA